MIGRFVGMTLCIMSVATLVAQDICDFIVIDQFGYLPDSRKVAVIRDPQVGFDADEAFEPGSWYALVDARSGELVFRKQIEVWAGGKTDESSGDKAWHFDFSEYTTPGRYYVLDQEQNVRSFTFEIAANIYNEILRQAMRTFFYQRVGFEKKVPYADERWSDGASHTGPLQDKNCRAFLSKDDPSTEKDLSGGWYDAGDYNKYTNWTSNYVVEFMKAYLEKPDAWADDYNIPESGNGIPDMLDEAIWGIDHLLRMQQSDGSVLSIVGEAHASPPSAATNPSYYGPPNTSATLNTAAAFAIASRVYKSIGMLAYADTLLARALKAWEWARIYPDSLFNNNDPDYNSLTLGAGTQEVNDYGRFMAKMEAACYLFGETGENRFREFFENNYMDVHMFQWTFVYPYEAANQELLLYYTSLPGASESVKTHIRSVYRNAMLNNKDNLPAYNGNKDPYQAHLGTYVWGSNGVKASQGSMSYNLITYGMDEGLTGTARDAAEGYLHYIHGVNPLNFVFLSNMYSHGAEKGVNEFYHSWFSNGSPLWDRVGVSTFGPAPGFLTGGANPGYDWDGCCPGGCGSSGNNSKCTAESISPPKGQPAQKSYKDFNTSWPLNSWSVTENSCGYQVRYIRLLSKFVSAGMDCNGEKDGGALIDSCGNCAGGNTGIIPSLDPDACTEGGKMDGDTMYIEGRHLYSAAGEKVVLMGVNEMFVWTDDKSGERLLPEIAKTGANCVRLVWIEEEGNKDILGELIDNCVDQQMIAMPECHSATGEWDKLDVCINFWKDPALMESIQGNKKWTLINIGNEVGNHQVTEIQFKDGYKRAIDSLRGWGYTVPLVIDASTWGQNVDMIFATWEEIQAHDPLHNVLFSVHSYWGDTRNYNRVASESVNKGLPVIIGEGPSPTRYPTCEMLDYETGLEVCALNEIGWLPWSWGGVAGNHCVPNFDLAMDGVFGDWLTSHAADMMVDHPNSLMRTSIRPSSFYPGDSVPATGIYFYPDLSQMTVGDTLFTEVLIAPVNALNKEYRFDIQGDTASISYDTLSGRLVAVAEGKLQMTAVSEDNDQVRFSREIRVKDIPVNSIRLIPSEAEILVGDTLFYQVEIEPESATVKDYYTELLDSDSVVKLDTASYMIVAQQAGTALLVVTWSKGTVADTLSISVSDPSFARDGLTIPEIRLYPNPNKDILNVECDQHRSFDMKIMDLSGKIVLEASYTGETRIKTDVLKPGTYLVVNKDEDVIIRQKLIIL
jgi:hypothetical protein